LRNPNCPAILAFFGAALPWYFQGSGAASLAWKNLPTFHPFFLEHFAAHMTAEADRHEEQVPLRQFQVGQSWEGSDDGVIRETDPDNNYALVMTFIDYPGSLKQGKGRQVKV
jgi:hypothetical protein